MKIRIVESRSNEASAGPAFSALTGMQHSGAAGFFGGTGFTGWGAIARSGGCSAGGADQAKPLNRSCVQKLAVLGVLARQTLQADQNQCHRDRGRFHQSLRHVHNHLKANELGHYG